MYLEIYSNIDIISLITLSCIEVMINLNKINF